MPCSLCNAFPCAPLSWHPQVVAKIQAADEDSGCDKHSEHWALPYGAQINAGAILCLLDARAPAAAARGIRVAGGRAGDTPGESEEHEDCGTALQFPSWGSLVLALDVTSIIVSRHRRSRTGRTQR